MAYCVLTDVQALNPKRIYDANSKPTATQVGSLITRVADEIDAILAGRGLVVPISKPIALVNALRHINATGGAALAEMGMFPEAGGIGATPHGQDLWKQYASQIAWLKLGDLPVGAEVGGESFSFFTEHPVTEPTEDSEWRKSKFGKGF